MHYNAQTPIPAQLLTVVQGDSYLTLDDRALVFDALAITGAGGLTNLQLCITPISIFCPSAACFCGPATAPTAPTVSTPPTPLQITGTLVAGAAIFELTAAQTTALQSGQRAYGFQATAQTQNGGTVTLARGQISVLESIL